MVDWNEGVVASRETSAGICIDAPATRSKLSPSWQYRVLMKCGSLSKGHVCECRLKVCCKGRWKVMAMRIEITDSTTNSPLVSGSRFPSDLIEILTLRIVPRPAVDTRPLLQDWRRCYVSPMRLTGVLPCQSVVCRPRSQLRYDCLQLDNGSQSRRNKWDSLHIILK